MTYSIKDVSKITGLSIFTIRFYDKEGLLPFVEKNKSGNREFTESDVGLMQMICCLKNTGMQLKDIKKYIDFCMEGPKSIASREKLLVAHRKEIIAHIDDLNKNLEIIDSKLEVYQSPAAVEIVSKQFKRLFEDKNKVPPTSQSHLV